MKILVIGPSWIGDTVISHSLYRILMQRHKKKKIQIDSVSPKLCYPIISRMPEINTIFTTPYTHGSLKLIQIYNLGKFLKSEKYQQTIILPNSFKSALIPFFAGIPIRTGWSGEHRYGLLNDVRILHTPSFPMMVQRYAALAYDRDTVQNFSELPSPFPYPILHVTKKEIENTLHRFNLPNNTIPLIGLCPGAAFGPAKRWPHYHYITLTIQLIRYGYHVIILGSHKDQLIRHFIEHSVILKRFQNNYHNLIGRTSLEEALIIIAACTGIVSNDSGLMHTACALRRPVVALYGGPSNPNFTPPLSCNNAVIRNIDEFYKIKNNNNLHGYHNSLISITPQQVLKTLQNLLN